MLKLHALLVASLCVVATNSYAMQQGMDIIDNSTEQDPARQAAVLAELTARNKRRRPLIESGLRQVTTSDQAYTFQKIATNSCNQKLAHKAHKLAVKLEEEEAGWQPNLVGVNLFPNSDSDSE